MVSISFILAENMFTSYHVFQVAWPVQNRNAKLQTITWLESLFLFVFVTPEGFTTVVANKGLEKARAYLNQVPPGPTALHPLRRNLHTFFGQSWVDS